MKKLKQILALIGVVLILGMYAATLIFALSSNPNWFNLFKAAVACTIAVPVLLWGITFIYNVLNKK